jgi:hypothetical protein
MAAALAVIAPLMTIGGTVINAMGQAQKGEAENQLAQMNANVAIGNAKLAREKGAEQERQVRREGAKALGTIQAGYGASGVTMEGSPLEVLEESARNAELDALTVRHSGEVKAIAFENEARAYRTRGASAQALGYGSAAGTALAGGGRFASMI